MAKRLSEQQLTAIREYMRGRSRGDALRIAGFSETYSLRPLAFFNNPKVQAEIKRRQMENEKKHEISVEWLCAKMVEVINSEGVSDANKLRALEMLGRNQGMFIDKVELAVKEDLVERLNKGRERVAIAKLARDKEAGTD